jgi:hypothetical protein
MVEFVHLFHFTFLPPNLLHFVYSCCPQHVVYDMAVVHVRMQLQERSQIIRSSEKKNPLQKPDWELKMAWNARRWRDRRQGASIENGGCSRIICPHT